MTEPFGFAVWQEVEYEEMPNVRYADWPVVARHDRWQVHLPHQCDDWVIVGSWPREGSSHEKAVAELERFIAEAQAALTALRERREFPTKETP